MSLDVPKEIVAISSLNKDLPNVPIAEINPLKRIGSISMKFLSIRLP